MSKSVSDRMAVAEKRYGKTTKGKTDRKPAPKAKISLKGTNPLKKKFAVTWKKEF